MADQRNIDADVDALPEARQADLGQYLLRNGDDGAAVVDRLDSSDLDTFLDQSPSTKAALTRVDRGDNGFDAARFIRNTDAEDRAVLDRLDGSTQTRLYLRYGEGDLDASNLRRINELIESGDMDQADVQRLLGILETRDTDPLIDESIEADDLLDVARKGDLSETRWTVNVRKEIPELEGETIWLEEGDSAAGFQHILERHGSKDQFYNMDGIDGPDDIERLIKKSINNGGSHRIPDEDGGGIAFEYVLGTGEKTTVIVGDNGFIVTSYPGGY